MTRAPLPDAIGYDAARDDAAYEGVFGWEEPARPLRGLNFNRRARQKDPTRDRSGIHDGDLVPEHAPASAVNPSAADAGASLHTSSARRSPGAA